MLSELLSHTEKGGVSHVLQAIVRASTANRSAPSLNSAKLSTLFELCYVERGYLFVSSRWRALFELCYVESGCLSQ